jgi:dTDP-4-dehydrorhamnose 3,5-epimerase
MIFREMEIKGAYIIEPERIEDERGFFARTWCQREFEKHGLNSRLVQTNISFSKNKGTLRGMHYQSKPHEEAKLIMCTKGEIFDVIIDLRPKSNTYKRYFSIRLTESGLEMLYVPEGFAHGFQTLKHDTEVLYQMSEFYDQGSACGVRWNDPAFAIEWPQSDIMIMSERDRNWPDYEG